MTDVTGMILLAEHLIALNILVQCTCAQRYTCVQQYNFRSFIKL